MIDVAIVSYSGRGTDVTRREDEALCEALSKRKREARILAWDQQDIPWSTVKICVVRSAFDWPFRRDQFLAWADATSRSSEFWNSPDLLRWGSHKSYLKDLESRGIAVIPSAFLSAGSRVDLSRLLEDRGWEEAVIKPAVGLASWGIARVSRRDATEGQVHADRLLQHRDVLVQPFLPAIETQGELSMIFIDGEISHALRRVPKAGDFRAHFLFGCAETPVPLSKDETALGLKIMATLGEGARFGRIDLIAGAEGRLLLSEVELVAPVLYFGPSNLACDRLADAIDRRLKALAGSDGD